jgi:hypothetical protein
MTKTIDLVTYKLHLNYLELGHHIHYCYILIKLITTYQLRGQDDASDGRHVYPRIIGRLI